MKISSGNKNHAKKAELDSRRSGIPGFLLYYVFYISINFILFDSAYRYLIGLMPPGLSFAKAVMLRRRILYKQKPFKYQIKLYNLELGI